MIINISPIIFDENPINPPKQEILDVNSVAPYEQPKLNLSKSKSRCKYTQQRRKGKQIQGLGDAHKLDEGLVAVGADVALGVDDLAEGFAELDKLLLGALPRQVPKV